MVCTPSVTYSVDLSESLNSNYLGVEAYSSGNCCRFSRHSLLVPITGTASATKVCKKMVGCYRNRKIYLPLHHKHCGDGVIGSRARLRIWWREPCGFEPHSPHEKAELCSPFSCEEYRCYLSPKPPFCKGGLVATRKCFQPKRLPLATASISEGLILCEGVPL